MLKIFGLSFTNKVNTWLRVVKESVILISKLCVPNWLALGAQDNRPVESIVVLRGDFNN